MLTIFKLSVFLLLHFTKMHLSKVVNFEKCTKCEKGDWGFPQNVKSQKSVCGVALQIGFFAFYFRKWLSTCYACQSKTSPLPEGWQSPTFYQFLERNSVMETKKRVRSTQFIIRAKPDEANTIRNRVKLSKKETFQAYALEMLLEGKIETYDYSELQKLRIEVNRIGQNVNQLVRYVNTFDEIDNELFKALQAEIDDMKALLINEFKTKGQAKLNGGDKSNPD